MINSIEIKNFKGIKDLKLENFSKINFFVGKANTGKTSILEALYAFLLKNPNDIMLLLDVRRMHIDSDAFQSFFYDYTLEKKPTIKSDDAELIIDCDRNSQYTNISTNKNNTITDLSNGINEINFIYKNSQGKKTFNIKKIFLNLDQIQFQHSLNLEGSFVFPEINDVDFIYQGSFYDNNLREYLSKIVEEKEKKEDLKKICKDFSEDIEELYFSKNKIVIQKTNLKNAINFKLLGEGFKKYIAIQASILSEKKYILIDELENGLHYEGIEKLLNAILKTNDDVQFFITTHNLELLQKLSEILHNEREEKISVFSIYEDSENNMKAFRLTQKNLINNIKTNSEVRD
ncbi:MULTISPECIES: ATP/GTP-binding protein [Helicobacter]|uniref:ATPase n=1 Tax=Helicobacter trogontum TaxID=50960 RepID=A0A4U8TDJ1_9HELI|nr:MULTISPECIES: AAA family ATPase [Helicobacter]MCI5786035.1 AAA family ATPase [Helicobacter trogontum]MCI7764930.1 AAA family ATPase [Helicobacter sp.]MDY5184584.1 AAA family ATPase [Helicobacter trogontum]TLD98081.1 ATPase [Helicobacter trogontum]